jgi:hypothetical protein
MRVEGVATSAPTSSRFWDIALLNAQALGLPQEAERQVVSIRLHGLIREEKDAPTTPFQEMAPAEAHRRQPRVGHCRHRPEPRPLSAPLA